MKKDVLIVLLLTLLPVSRAMAQDTLYLPSPVIDSVIEEAQRHIGVPYHWGGKTPAGFDCAGFTRYVYGRFGYFLAPSAAPQYKQGTPVERADLQRGDLVFFGGRKGGRSIGHVGIVTSVDSTSFNFIHASSSGVRITGSNDPYYRQRYLNACRLVKPLQVIVMADNGDTAAADSNALAMVDTLPPVPSDTLPAFVTVAMVGDMMLGTTYPDSELPRNDGDNLFDDVRELLVGADIAVGNCEGAMCDSGECTKKKGKYSYAFRMPPAYGRHFLEAGFDFLSLANNHSNDFGTAGIRQTMNVFDSLGIAYAGVEGLCESALVRRGGVTYGFCAFGHNSYTYRTQDTATVRRLLTALRDSCDLLVVSFHGGAEGKDQTHLPEGTEMFLGENRGNLRSFAHLCIDLGADLVYGHGPHVCRAIELYKGHLIAYSLGNFCTAAGINVTGISGYAPVVTARMGLDGRLIDGRIHSFIQPYHTGPRRDDSNRVAQFIRQLTQQDFVNPGLTIADDGSFAPVE